MGRDKLGDKDRIVKRIRSLLVPFFMWSAIAIPVHAAMMLVLGQTGWEVIPDLLLMTVTLRGASTLWSCRRCWWAICCSGWCTRRRR
ncbi:MAG: hypothetical protein IKR73_10190 [Oscillospiraceae bacterium]|nr:hypothetical protein [Oscillospiraceae bacterium]